MLGLTRDSLQEFVTTFATLAIQRQDLGAKGRSQGRSRAAAAGWPNYSTKALRKAVDLTPHFKVSGTLETCARVNMDLDLKTLASLGSKIYDVRAVQSGVLC